MTTGDMLDLINKYFSAHDVSVEVEPDHGIETWVHLRRAEGKYTSRITLIKGLDRFHYSMIKRTAPTLDDYIICPGEVTIEIKSAKEEETEIERAFEEILDSLT